MSAWRRAALELLPEFRNLIEAAPQVMGAWVELTCEFQRAYSQAPPKADLIRRFYAFARWCVQHPSTGTSAEFDPSTAAVVAFYEDLPMVPRAWEELTIYVSLSDIKQMEAVFRYHATDAQMEELRRKLGRA